MTPHKSHSREWLFCWLLCCLLLLTACGDDRTQVQLRGAIMGTTWQVSYIPAADAPIEERVFKAIDHELQTVEHAMSTYREDSEITAINTAPVQQEIILSTAFLTVLRAALQVGQQSGGAYDVTVMPLVEAWGFGPGEPVTQPPEADRIASLLDDVGQQHLVLRVNESALTKSKAVTIDFSSLAKGYAVDRVAQALEAMGVDDYLVEVGGEMKLSGFSVRGDLWRIAIEQPNAAARAVAVTIALSDKAVATSGDYRNFFEADGKRYSHTIDPRTGYPVAHDLVSATVVHDSAMLADAWATALLVLGAEAAAAIAQEQGLAVYFIRRIGDDFVHEHSAAFATYLLTDDA